MDVGTRDAIRPVLHMSARIVAGRFAMVERSASPEGRQKSFENSEFPSSSRLLSFLAALAFPTPLLILPLPTPGCFIRGLCLFLLSRAGNQIQHTLIAIVFILSGLIRTLSLC